MVVCWGSWVEEEGDGWVGFEGGYIVLWYGGKIGEGVGGGGEVWVVVCWFCYVFWFWWIVVVVLWCLKVKMLL